ncbi:unnamed protein product [Timema podura]|uniref:Uncharacterized protein n=1 Tax=Timema podura TaxID=61482 RepID=A0ABN7PDK7_TIMPD|nr:unnamed protein product [Timema podura]
MEFADINSCIQDFNDLGNDYKVLEDLNKEYITKLEEVSDLQSKCVKEVGHQKYRLGILSGSIKK